MVAAWTWILVYVVGFAAFQLLIYRYLQRDDAAFEHAAPDYGEGDREHAPPGLDHANSNVPAEDEDVIRCRHCGTRNDAEQTYTYCRECVQPLR